jgi:RNA polymerase sigma-70 factor (ECF subfamily)
VRRDLELCSDAQLLERAQQDPDAFAVFYGRHVKAVLSYAAYRTGDTQLALDVTSEVFLAALAGAGSYSRAKGPGRAWLFGIVNNKLASEFKRQKRERGLRRKLGVPFLEFSDQAIEEAEDLIDASESSFLQGLDELSPTERDAVRAHIIESRDYEEIASAEKVSQATIRKRVSRGLTRLAELADRKAS